MPSGSVCTRYGRPDRSTVTWASDSSSGQDALPNRRMPDLSPSACRNAAPERERGVLDRVVGVDVQVALGLHGQVEQAVPAELGEHVVEEADPGGHVDRPGAVEVDLDEHRRLLRRALDAPDPAHAPSRRAPSRSSTRVSAARNAAISSLGADRHPQPLRRADLPDQHAPARAAPPTPRAGRRTGRTARSSRRSRRPRGPGRAATPRSRPARRAARRRCRAARSVCASATRAAAWVSVDRWYGRRTSWQRLDHRRVGGEVAEAGCRPWRTPSTWSGRRSAAGAPAAG